MEDNLHATRYSLVNSLRTGNIILDVFISFMIPFLMTMFMRNGSRMVDKLRDHFKKYGCAGSYYYRFIEYTQCNDEDQMIEEESDRTYILLRALKLYINASAPSDYSRGIVTYTDTYNYAASSVSDMSSSLSNGKLLKEMMRTEVITRPKMNEWCRLTDTLEYRHNKEDDMSGNNNEIRRYTTSIELRSNLSASDAEDYIEKALNWYKNVLEKSQKKERYMFMMSKESPPVFDKYVLSDNKTFSTLFIPNQLKIIQTITEFHESRGRFAVEGMPRQLNICMRGPPGTGKTSFTKALSSMTERHIVDVPLSRIKTNRDLYNIMFGQTYKTSSQTHRYPYDHTIFIIEDIDCVMDVVSSRKDLASIAKKEISAVEKMDRAWMDDPLNLAGLLNAMDGPIDAPGRIVVISTNHPEKLDPALLRAGRINMDIMFDFIKQDEALDMISHYVGKVTGEYAEKLLEILTNNDVTPAQIEKACMSSTSVSGVIEDLMNQN